MKTPIKDLPEKIKSFFDALGAKSEDTKGEIFVCRTDGVLLYAKDVSGTKSKGQDNAAVGALIGGLWQAAQALMTFIPGKNSSEEFRLSFDTSSQGVYVLPFKTENKEYYLGILYFDEVNPGAMKARLRNIKFNLQQYLKDSKSNTKHSDNKGEYLFKDLSDSEIDRLFSFTGNL